MNFLSELFQNNRKDVKAENPKLEDVKQIFDRELFALKDEAYKEFNKKLIPNISEDVMIGIRTPALRALAKKLWKEERDKCLQFMDDLPHHYFEENNLHAYLIEEIKELEETLRRTQQFLPYIDNWATCDTFLPKVFAKHPDVLLDYIKKWLHSDEAYTIRYGIGLLLSNYLDKEFKPEYLEWVCDVESQEYYVKMMIAWYFSFALIKQYEYTFPIIKEQRLERWTHNKAIQKARESSRISSDTKELLKQYKR